MPKELRTGGRIGDLYKIGRAIDRPAGHFARTFAARDLRSDQDVAFKILRRQHLDLPEDQCLARYEAFAREVDLLTALQEDERVINLYDTGYVAPPSDEAATRYKARSIGPNLIAFRALMKEAYAKKWRPYLTLQILPARRSLHNMVINNQRGLALPMVEAIDLSLQLVDLLVKIHAQDIVYFDAKPAHLYWDGQQASLIDWNVSFRLDEDPLSHFGQPAAQLKAQDVVIIGREFIYPAFIGLDFRSGKKPPSVATPSAQQIQADRAYDYQGNVSLYGHERTLDEAVQIFLKRVVQSQIYENAEALREDLENCALQLGWSFTHKKPNRQAALALAHKRRAVKHLREAQNALTAAVDALEASNKALTGNADTNHLLTQTDQFLEQSVLP